MNKNILPLIAYSLCILAFISGCAPTTTMETISTPVIELEATDGSALAQGERLLQQARLEEQPDGLLLQAAILFAGDPQRIADTLAMIDSDQLTDPEYIQFILLSTQLDISMGRALEASTYLQQERFIFISPDFDLELQLRAIRLQAEIDLALGNAEQSLQGYIQLAAMSRGQRDTRVVHDHIWRQLNAQPFSYLQQGRDHRDSQLAGWLQLAELNRLYQVDHSARQQALKDWRQRWRTHPAAKLSPTALNRAGRYDKAPSQVALLLPLQGQYEMPSYTLLDGFMGAYYNLLAQQQSNIEPDSGTVPDIRIYDSSADSMEQVYNSAVEDGAELIIGPMRRSEVEDLLPLEALPVPTISLNRIDNNNLLPPKNLYQFGLSPLDEVSQIADRAWQKGQRNVLIVAPDNGWGNRAAVFFNQYWNNKGGTVLSQVIYPSATRDFTPLLKPPLQIDLSEERGRQLRRFINSRIQTSARRRQDIDLVVVLGYPMVARQIKPALDFLYASDVPVVATSHIYNGTAQASLDRDLSSVEFSAMPWTLPGQLAKPLQPDQRLHTAYRHLYAVGYDAFLLHRNLKALESETALPLFGATGLLSLSNGVIERQQKWATFQRGKVIAIQP